MNGFYTAAQATRIARVPRSTLDYWIRTDLVRPEARQRRPRLFSFEDLRDLVVTQQLREQGARVRDIRAALNYVREADEVARLTTADFRVSGGQLVYETPEGPVAPHRRGQRIFTVDMREVFAALGAEKVADVVVLRPAPHVYIDPRVRGGAPVVEGTRIPTQLIYAMSEEGLTPEQILEYYPTLTTEDVGAAVRWERDSRTHAA